MNTVDNTTFKNSLTHAQKNVMVAFLQGHIISIKGEDYRFAEKGDLLWTETTDKGDVEWSAMEDGLFMRAYEFDGQATDYTPEHATGFRWITYGDRMGTMLSLIRDMSEKDMIVALGNKTLTEINQTRRES